MCQNEDRHTGLEQHESECFQYIHFWVHCSFKKNKNKRMSTVAMHSLRQICHTVADVYDTLGSQPITERSHRRNFSLTVRYCSDGRGRTEALGVLRRMEVSNEDE